ncbi:nitroreductase family protein [Thermotalea metallivorans]|uniref:Nitroreductase domain-containing protein n=1 Tax=Thermotalea metallivorans TaxID=520762 RepID=A0A140L160_9FIRM|nr:nitroreductase family protein [Thermotalea metallivorans]KXG74285.1 hypothetical protein AN619_24770 [Thermotalea metallivorans]
MENYIKDEVKGIRETAYPINPLILNRWSPRAISEEEITEKELFTLLEAARWAPSCYNEQPWRFILARKKEDRERFYEFLTESNRIWAEKAPVLIAWISKTNFTENGKVNRWHGFDAGTAWGYLSLEGERQGLLVHAMGGFSVKKAKEILGLDDDHDIFAIIAVGKRGKKEMLPIELQEREKPSGRKPLDELVFEGSFQNK